MNLTTAQLLSTYQNARKKSVPLIAWTSPDPAASIRSIATVSNGSPLICWDIVRGMQGLNAAGRDAVTAVLGGDDPAMKANPVESLMLANQFPDKSVFFMLNSQRIISEYPVIQAIWNLRDTYKVNGRCLMLMNTGINLPAELSNDVLALDEPLPDDTAIAEILSGLHKDAGLEVPESFERAIDAVRGIPAYPVEQAAALSLSRAGLDTDGLWERKRRLIEQTKGLSVWRGRETFADVAGNQNVKNFLSQIFAGKRKPRAIAFIDEIEKTGMSNDVQDSSGTSTDQKGTLLSYMQDVKAKGIMCVGAAGSGKTMIAQTAGNTAGIPTIKVDFGAMKGSLVGESEQALRTALKVISAVSQGEVLFIATSNNIASLPPELRRRFKRGTFFFDLPNVEERAAIWALYLRKYDLEGQVIPPSEGWTGAEIEQCCEMADALGCTLKDAATYVVPVCKSDAERIERLRREASGKFISANLPGTYQYQMTASTTSRGMEL